MGGGASGGPWLNPFNMNTGSGFIVSVNSFGFSSTPSKMGGPSLSGNSAECLFEHAKTYSLDLADKGHIIDCAVTPAEPTTEEVVVCFTLDKEACSLQSDNCKWTGKGKNASCTAKPTCDDGSNGSTGGGGDGGDTGGGGGCAYPDGASCRNAGGRWKGGTCSLCS